MDHFHRFDGLLGQLDGHLPFPQIAQGDDDWDDDGDDDGDEDCGDDDV